MMPPQPPQQPPQQPQQQAPQQGQQLPAGVTPSTDILWNSLKGQMKPGTTPGRFFGGIQHLLKQGGHLFQVGKTVFLLQPKAPGVVQFHMASQEPVQQLVQNFRIGAQSMKKLGAKKVFAITNQPAYARLARMTGLPVKVSRDPQGYRLELDL